MGVGSSASPWQPLINLNNFPSWWRTARTFRCTMGQPPLDTLCLSKALERETTGATEPTTLRASICTSPRYVLTLPCLSMWAWKPSTVLESLLITLLTDWPPQGEWNDSTTLLQCRSLVRRCTTCIRTTRRWHRRMVTVSNTKKVTSVSNYSLVLISRQMLIERKVTLTTRSIITNEHCPTSLAP